LLNEHGGESKFNYEYEKGMTWDPYSFSWSWSVARVRPISKRPEIVVVKFQEEKFEIKP